MGLRFSTLASGSRGNSSVVEIGSRKLLIDVGLSARTLKSRLGRLGLKIQDISEVILTHTHSDHVNDTALALLAEHGVTFWCHEEHSEYLEERAGFRELMAECLVQHYDEIEFTTGSGVTVYPYELSHGAGKTFGFRLDYFHEIENQRSSIGYLADLGCWTEPMASHFRDCSMLAIEFNHDVQMTLQSKRHPFVIKRNLSDDGHLSNEQASGLLRTILGQTYREFPAHVVLLHISDQCNTHEMAESAANGVVEELGLNGTVQVHVASQGEVQPWLEVPFFSMDEPREVILKGRPKVKVKRRSGKAVVLAGQLEFRFQV